MTRAVFLPFDHKGSRPSGVWGLHFVLDGNKGRDLLSVFEVQSALLGCFSSLSICLCHYSDNCILAGYIKRGTFSRISDIINTFRLISTTSVHLILTPIYFQSSCLPVPANPLVRSPDPQRTQPNQQPSQPTMYKPTTSNRPTSLSSNTSQHPCAPSSPASRAKHTQISH